MLKIIHISILKKKFMIKILNLKLVILLKCICQIYQEKYSLLRILKILYHGHVINDLNGEEIIGAFYENELQKTDQKEFRTEKALKKKGDKLYVKWKGYENSFNNWIHKKDIV